MMTIAQCVDKAGSWAARDQLCFQIYTTESNQTTYSQDERISSLGRKDFNTKDPGQYNFYYRSEE